MASNKSQSAAPEKTPLPRRTAAKATAADAQQQASVVRLCGERLKLARELNQLSMQEAATRMGFANKASLSKFETAKHVAGIPLWVIAKAAEVYEVSADYLLGVTDDWQVAPRIRQSREVTAWLQSSLEKYRTRDLDTLSLLHEGMVRIVTGQGDISVAVQELAEATDKFRELNPRFVDMRGGASVIRCTENAMRCTSLVSAQLAKFRGVMRASRTVPDINEAQLNLGLLDR